ANKSAVCSKHSFPRFRQPLLHAHPLVRRGEGGHMLDVIEHLFQQIERYFVLPYNICIKQLFNSIQLVSINRSYCHLSAPPFPCYRQGKNTSYMFLSIHTI